MLLTSQLASWFERVRETARVRLTQLNLRHLQIVKHVEFSQSTNVRYVQMVLNQRERQRKCKLQKTDYECITFFQISK